MTGKRDLMNMTKDAAFALPQVMMLMYRLVRDPRVDRRRRALAVGALGYAVVPFDVLPDWIPFLGRLDDVLVAALAVRLLLEGTDEEIIREHWDGPDDVLQTFVRITDLIAGAVPKSVRSALAYVLSD